MSDTNWPRIRYSPGCPDGLVCESAEHNRKLGPGWYESPGEFPKLEGSAEVAPALVAPAGKEARAPRKRRVLQ